MLRTTGLWLALIALAVFSPGASAQSACGWMSTAQLDRLLPFGAPWQVRNGGESGFCSFDGRNAAGHLSLSATQMVLGSAAEAEKMARDSGIQMGNAHPSEPLPALGKHGLVYRVDSAGERMSLSYIGHHRKVALNGSLDMPGTGFDAKSEGIIAFFRAALELGDDRKAQRAARACPYVSDRVAKKLLAGGKYEMQQYGEDSCVAHNNKGAALTVARSPDTPAEYDEPFRDDTCAWAPAAQLPGGMLGAHCAEGNPRAVLWLRIGSDLFNYSFVPGGREPTAAEKELLVELGRRFDVSSDLER
jgi:hypothetical protein